MSCYVFGKRRGQNLKCTLCSRYGGAMRPTNVPSRDEFLVKNKCVVIQSSRDADQSKNNSHSRGKKPKKVQNLANRTFKSEEKNATLNNILHQEHLYLVNAPNLEVTEKEAEADSQSSFYDHMDENLNYKIEEKYKLETKYAWAHLSCANFIPEIDYTAKSPLKIGKLTADRFDKACIIC